MVENDGDDAQTAPSRAAVGAVDVHPGVVSLQFGPAADADNSGGKCLGRSVRGGQKMAFRACTPTQTLSENRFQALEINRLRDRLALQLRFSATSLACPLPSGSRVVKRGNTSIQSRERNRAVGGH